MEKKKKKEGNNDHVEMSREHRECTLLEVKGQRMIHFKRHKSHFWLNPNTIQYYKERETKNTKRQRKRRRKKAKKKKSPNPLRALTSYLFLYTTLTHTHSLSLSLHSIHHCISEWERESDRSGITQLWVSLLRQSLRRRRRLPSEEAESRFDAPVANWSWRWRLAWRSSCVRLVNCLRCFLRSSWKSNSRPPPQRRRRLHRSCLLLLLLRFLPLTLRLCLRLWFSPRLLPRSRSNTCRRTVSIRRRSRCRALTARPFSMSLMAWPGSLALSATLTSLSICPSSSSSINLARLRLRLRLPRKSTRFCSFSHCEFHSID